MTTFLCHVTTSFGHHVISFLQPTVQNSNGGFTTLVILIVFDVHISDICRPSFYQLRNLSKVRKYLTRESSEIAMHAFITSKLDYCISLLYGCRKMQLKKLQYVQNTAARIITRTRKFDQITPVLSDLHWLPVSYRFVFKFFC